MQAGKLNPQFSQALADSYTKLLWHFDGADGAVVSNPATGQVATFGGTAQIDTAQSVFGGASLLLDGNSDYVTVPDSADWTFGTGDFTIDCRARRDNTNGNTQLIACQYQSDTNYWYLGIMDNHKFRFRAVVGGSVVGDFEQTTATMSLDTWYHLEFVRSGSTAYMLIDGTSVAVTQNNAFADLSDLSGVLSIGRMDASNGLYFFGWIDELRISKGIARHTASFTIPTAPYELLTTTGKINFPGFQEILDYTADGGDATKSATVDGDVDKEIKICVMHPGSNYMLFRINNDSTSNIYGRQYLANNSGSLGAGRDANNFSYIAYPKSLSETTLLTPSGFIKTLFRSWSSYSSGTTISDYFLAGLSHNITGNVTTLDFYMNSGNIPSGTRIYVGVRRSNV